MYVVAHCWWWTMMEHKVSRVRSHTCRAGEGYQQSPRASLFRSWTTERGQRWRWKSPWGGACRLRCADARLIKPRSSNTPDASVFFICWSSNTPIKNNAHGLRRQQTRTTGSRYFLHFASNEMLQKTRTTIAKKCHPMLTLYSHWVY